MYSLNRSIGSSTGQADIGKNFIGPSDVSQQITFAEMEECQIYHKFVSTMLTSIPVTSVAWVRSPGEALVFWALRKGV